MFITQLSADLPSEEVPGAAPDDDSLSTTHERVSYSPARLLRTLKQVFEQSEITDVAYVVIDGREVYVDTDESDGRDLDLLLSSAQEEGFLATEFNELVLALTVWEEGLQHVVEARVRTAVPHGEHELTVVLSSRPDDFNVRRLDDAPKYQARMQEILGDIEAVAAYRAAAERVAGRIDAALRRTLFRRTVLTGRTDLHIVRPRIEDLKALESIAFSSSLEPPTYHVVPPPKPIDVDWPDPAQRVYSDRFIVYRHWVMLDTLMNRGALRVEWVQVIEPDGRRLFEGHKARWFEQWPWAQKFSLKFIEGGRITITIVGT